MWIRFISAVTAVFAGATEARGQSLEEIREELRRNASDAHIGDLVQGLTGFAALPGVSAANFKVNETLQGSSATRMTKFVLPLAHDFDDVQVSGRPLYGELTFGYLHSDQSVDGFLEGSEGPTDVDSEFSAYSAVAGLGATFQLGTDTTIRPIVLAGYTYVDEQNRFSGPGKAAVDELTRGILFNLHGNVALLGAALQIEHQHDLPHDIQFTGRLRYNQLHAETFAASDPVLETGSNYGVFTSFAQFDGPLGIELFGRKLRWIGFIANSSFPGNQSRSLGFDYFFEFGGGLEIVDEDVLRGIEGISLRGSALVGEDLNGWSVGMQIEF